MILVEQGKHEVVEEFGTEVVLNVLGQEEIHALGSGGQRRAVEI